MKKTPQRTEEHVLEGRSNRLFQNCLPANWTNTKPSNDYGIDYTVNIFDSTNPFPYGNNNPYQR